MMIDLKIEFDFSKVRIKIDINITIIVNQLSKKLKETAKDSISIWVREPFSFHQRILINGKVLGLFGSRKCFMFSLFPVFKMCTDNNKSCFHFPIQTFENKKHDGNKVLIL